TTRLTASVLAAGSGPPVKCTECRPLVSLPLIDHVPSRKLDAVGLNRTVSVSVWPPAIVVPSGSCVVAAKSPPTGGFERAAGAGVRPGVGVVDGRRGDRPAAARPTA